MQVYHKRIDFASASKYNTCMETKTVTIRLPEDVLKELKELANEHTRSLNGEMLVALREYVKQQRQGLKPGEKPA
jgi:predicted transcriptional regulator